MKKELLDILDSNTPSKIRALFSFDKDTLLERVETKYLYWSRYFFPQFFSDPKTGKALSDASFHKQIDIGNTGVYLFGGRFLNVAFRNSAKTTRTKLFTAFAIANDISHYRKYLKVLSKEMSNAKQFTTDVYNLLVSPKVRAVYPEIFQKTDAKREETMTSFTTATGIKMFANSIGTDQRGDIQDESRPDYLIFDDIETKKSLTSAPTTYAIWLNMDEAIQGLSKDGGVVYLANYISERGNVHKLVEREKNKIIIPIVDDKGDPTWNRYSKEDIERIKEVAEDWEGDYLSRPSAARDVYFNREAIDKQISKEPIDNINGFKLFYELDESHRVGGGMDVAGGVGLDSSTEVYLDFDTNPIRVIATYKDNMVKPDEFAYIIAKHGKRLGECFVGPEKNNYGHATLAILKNIYPNSKIYKTQHLRPSILPNEPKEFGWDTNWVTKNKMMADLSQAIDKGMIELNDEDLIREARSYTTGDLMDKEIDPRLTTRHFDLLVALAIAYQMNKYVPKPEEKEPFDYYYYRRDKLAMSDEENIKNPAI